MSAGGTLPASADTRRRSNDPASAAVVQLVSDGLDLNEETRDRLARLRRSYERRADARTLVDQALGRLARAHKITMTALADIERAGGCVG